MNREGAPRPSSTASDALPVIAETLPVEQLRRSLYRAVALPVGMMLLLCALLGWQVAALIDEAEVVAGSHAAIDEMYEVQALLLDREAGLHGDRSLGDEAYAQLPARLDRLRALVDERPEQRARVAAIEAAHGEWTAVRGSPGPVDADLRPRKPHMLEIRRLSAELIAAESELLHAREREAARHRKTTIVGGAALLLAFGAFMATFLRRWLRTMEHTYAKALARSVQSEAGERAARQAAEALAGEITAQSKELTTRLTTMRRELAEARAHRREA